MPNRSNEFFGPPPRAGTRLNCTSRIVDIYTKQGRKGGEMTFAVMTTDFEDEQGNLIARATMTGVGNRSTDCGGILINTVSVPTPWVVGPVSAHRFRQVPRCVGRHESDSSRPGFSPRRRGTRVRFRSGCSKLGSWPPSPPIGLGAENIRAIRVRFLEQVWPDDTLTCSALVERTYADDEGDKIDVELACTRQTGGLAVKAWATFVRPPLVPSERP